MASPKNVFLVWGAKGWIGGLVIDLLKQQGKTVHGTTARLHEQDHVRKELDEHKPTHVINCAGKTGIKNVDWCEDHKLETMESNGLGAFILAHECAQRNIHLTVAATGCIYTSTYNDTREKLLSAPFKETDPPNFTGSFYSATKAPMETFLSHYPNCLTLRFRMPVASDLHPRSFVTKILHYARIVNVPNSHSHLPSLLPALVAMAEHRETGVYNFTNPGCISHNEVLELYRDLVDSTRTWENFSVEEQAEVIVAERSNCVLDTGKLEACVARYVEVEGLEGLRLPEIHEAYRMSFGEMARVGGGLQQKGGAGGVEVVD